MAKIRVDSIEARTEGSGNQVADVWGMDDAESIMLLHKSVILNKEEVATLENAGSQQYNEVLWEIIVAMDPEFSEDNLEALLVEYNRKQAANAAAASSNAKIIQGQTFPIVLDFSSTPKTTILGVEFTMYTTAVGKAIYDAWLALSGR